MGNINIKRRADKKSESSIELVAHTGTLTQQKQLNGSNYHISLNIDTQLPHFDRQNWIKKEDPTICCLQETHLTD
jgi:hypothetical protein